MIDVGTVLRDRYEVTRLLARGGMAAVYVAHDRTLDRPVAVKVVTGTTADQRQRLQREARLLAGFQHPNLVRVYDAEHLGDDAYVVLEYVDGPTLADVIGRGAVASERVALVGAEVADALAYIHSRGVIHRDVKPSNVFVGTDGRTRLSDFGIARHADDAQLTQTGMVIGTGAYMAPEQVEGGTVGPPADIYALGLVLLECLTGTRAYPGPAAEAAMARLSRDPDLSAAPPRWAAELAAMTARDPSSRPSASVCASRLRALPLVAADGTDVLPVAATTVGPAMTEPPRRARRRLPVVGAIIAIVIALAFALVALSRGGSPTTDVPTTTSTTRPPSTTTTTTKPTTTTSRCAGLQSERKALEDEERALDQLKGKALRDAQKELQDRKDALDQQLEECDD